MFINFEELNRLIILQKTPPLHNRHSCSQYRDRLLTVSNIENTNNRYKVRFMEQN